MNQQKSEKLLSFVQARLDMFFCFINKWYMYNQCCDKLHIKRKIEQSFLVKFDVKLNTIACKGITQQQNRIK